MIKTAVTPPRPAAPAADGPWPLTARPAGTAGLASVGGVALREIAAEYGTPAYVLDERDIRQRCRDYRAAFPDSEVAYASQAFLCRFMARCAEEEGLSLAVRTAGELSVAASADFPAERVIVHGSAKTPGDIRAALEYRASRVVIDGTAEISRLAAQVPLRQQVLLRVAAAVCAGAPTAAASGFEDHGGPAGGMAEAVRRVAAQPSLDLVGLHCHIGTQVTTPASYVSAGRRLVGLMAAIRDEHALLLSELNLGGGHGVPHAEGDAGLDLAATAREVRAAVAAACTAARLPVPRITVEPGRALVARAGVTLYRVVAVRHRADGRVFVAVDGGISDNPRPVLSGTSYSVRVAGRPAGHQLRPATVVGRHGESGDVLARDLPLPAALRPGDLLAAAGTGAYHHSMSSNYNMVGRPPVIAVRDGSARVLIRRETDADLRHRDVGW